MPNNNLTHKTLTIDNSGTNGNSGLNGENGKNGGRHGARGKDGTTGMNGQHGEDASDIDVHLSTDELQQTVNILTNDYQSYTLPLRDKDAEIYLYSNGGDGGHGGNGGNGGHGSRGENGEDDLMYFSGSDDGGNGGDGGKGGNGGRGGNGGDGGNVTVIVNEADLDLLMLVNPYFKGGLAGHGGFGGKGGKGGVGGLGGDSFLDGGGSDGYYGRNGRGGDPGNSGSIGKDGYFNIVVPNLGVFHNLYSGQITNYDPINDNCVIEPGARVAINHLTFTNTSEMPTPHTINFSIVPNKWLEFNSQNALSIEESVKPMHSITSENPLFFDVTSDIPGSVDTTFNVKTNLEFQATLPRINKNLENIMPYEQIIELRYPVETSLLSYAKAITHKEEAPLVFKIRNISNTTLGNTYPSFRPVRFTIEIQDENKIGLQLYSPITDTTQNAAKYAVDLTELKPGESYTFAATFKFTEETPKYTQVNLKVKLDLADQTHSYFKTIQVRNFKLQLADNYEYLPEADFVLVTNADTKAETIAAWENVINKLGGRLSIWNTSHYQGLSYTQQRRDGGSFVTELKDKVVIILNNNFKIDENNQKISTDCLDPMEIFNAAKEHNIATYVIGNGFDLATSTLPLKNNPNEINTVSATKHLFFLRTPKEKHLFAQARDYNDQCIKAQPTSHQVAIVEFKPKKIRGCFIDKWQLGSIEYRPALNRQRVRVANRQNNLLVVLDSDVYNIIKLLPLEKKLKYLQQSVYDANDFTLVKLAILSDLSDELRAFNIKTWKGDFDNHKLKDSLKFMQFLCNYDFNNIYNNKHDDFREMLLTCEYLLQRLPDTSDKYLFPWLKLRRNIEHVCQDKLQPILNKYYSSSELQQGRDQIKNVWKNIKKEDLYRYFSYPSFTSQTQYDNQDENNHVIKKSSLPFYNERLSSFKEGQHFFKTKEEREKCLGQYEELCKFDLDLPPKSFSMS